jgi:prevent-host-death family protein
MRTVNIGTLKNQLSAYLKYVRNGEEVIVRDRNVPVARILPFSSADLSDEEAQLVASGKMTLPQDPSPIDWDAFLAIPSGNVSAEAVMEAIDWVKGEN